MTNLPGKFQNRILSYQFQTATNIVIFNCIRPIALIVMISIAAVAAAQIIISKSARQIVIPTFTEKAIVTSIAVQNIVAISSIYYFSITTGRRGRSIIIRMIRGVIRRIIRFICVFRWL